MTRGGTSTAAPSAAQEESPPAPAPRLPFYAAGDIVAGDSGFARVHGRKMRRLAEAVEVTRAGVAHGYGTIARRRVARGECFVDPCAVALGRPALAWVLLRDVEPGEELLVAYDA